VTRFVLPHVTYSSSQCYAFTLQSSLPMRIRKHGREHQANFLISRCEPGHSAAGDRIAVLRLALNPAHRISSALVAAALAMTYRIPANPASRNVGKPSRHLRSPGPCRTH
jgi:hypothetical protein